MIKSVIALSVSVLLGAIIALPGFAVQAEAGDGASAQGVQVEAPPAALNCSQQTWPNFEARCLKDGASGGTVRQVRLVTPHR